MLRKYRIKDYDFKLVIMLIAISIIGILAVGSAEKELQQKQLMGFLLGLFLMVVISLFDYAVFLRFWWVIYAVNMILLLLVLFFGKEVSGAQRWLDIGIQFQPSELAKILLILFYAKFIMKYEEKINDIKVLFFAILLVAPPLLLIVNQPDLSTTIMIFIVFCTLFFVGGISYKYVFGILGVAVPTLVILFIQILQPDQTIIRDYQRNRIMAWLHPEDYATTEAYQQLNSIMAIGSGQLSGKGLNNNVVNSVKNGNFISEPQTDFIFTIIGEELGFIGGCLVVLLVVGIAVECVIIAYKAKDTAGKIIAAGMGALIGFQGTLNICVATGLMPNTGIPLPFVSAGLTSMVALYIGMGFVLNVRLQAIRKYNN